MQELKISDFDLSKKWTKANGKKLEQFRKAKGFSKENLASKLKLHPITITRWERGSFSPRALYLKECLIILKETSPDKI